MGAGATSQGPWQVVHATSHLHYITSRDTLARHTGLYLNEPSLYNQKSWRVSATADRQGRGITYTAVEQLSNLCSAQAWIMSAKKAAAAFTNFSITCLQLRGE